MATVDRGAAREWAEATVREAGARAKAMWAASDFSVQRKADGSVVTDIDRTIEQWIRGEIAARFPGHAVLGEEFGHDPHADSDAPLWAIDPVDGTTNLANGLPHWGVSLGLVDAGEPVVGALSFPLLDETYVAAKGLGATRNGVALPALPPGGPTTWDDTYGMCSVSIRRVDFRDVPVRVRVVGSAALELCWVAAGRFRGCQSIGVSLYDIAAGVVVAGEVGATAAWLRDPHPWNATAMLREGRRENDILVTAPPETRAFLLSHLHLRDEATPTGG